MKISRDWVKLHTGILSDEQFLDLSANAKVAYLAGLAKAGLDATDGVVPCSARSVARWTGLEVAEAAAAVSELENVGFWSVDGAVATIRNWGAYQPLNDVLAERREAAAARLAKFREKKRAEKSTTTSTDGNELDAAGVRSKLWSAMNRAVRDEMSQDAAVGVYRTLYAQAIEAGSEGGRYAGVKGVGPAMLANQVVNHAALRWLGMEPDSPQLRRLHALRKDHGVAVIDAMPLAAVGAKGDPIAYLNSVLRKGGTR